MAHQYAITNYMENIELSLFIFFNFTTAFSKNYYSSTVKHEQELIIHEQKAEEKIYICVSYT